MPYDSRFVGDPTTGVLHGGAVTALLDATAGAAAFMALDDLTSMATLDLRIDYLRPARAGETLLSHADCYRTTSTVAFLRCRAEHADGTLVATGAATFMIGTPMGIGGKP
jgi:uncharacterized protein (TIGR00369 family)